MQRASGMMQKQSNGSMVQEFFGGRRFSFTTSLNRRGSASSLNASQSNRDSWAVSQHQGSVMSPEEEDGPVQALYDADGIKQQRRDPVTANMLGSFTRSRKVGIEPTDTAAVTPQATGPATGQQDNNAEGKESFSIDHSQSTDNLLVVMTRKMSRQFSARVGVEPVSAVTAAAGAAYQVSEDTPAAETNDIV